MGWNSGVGASFVEDDDVRILFGVALRRRLEVVAMTGEDCGVEALCLPVLYGDPKTSFFAGLSGLRRTSVKRAEARLRDEGLVVRAGENIASSLSIRCFVGLRDIGAPGERGRLFGLDLKKSGSLMLEAATTKDSGGSSCRGPGRRMMFHVVSGGVGGWWWWLW
jgi:hypothetical protein